VAMARGIAGGTGCPMCVDAARRLNVKLLDEHRCRAHHARQPGQLRTSRHSCYHQHLVLAGARGARCRCSRRRCAGARNHLECTPASGPGSRSMATSPSASPSAQADRLRAANDSAPGRPPRHPARRADSRWPPPRLPRNQPS
jgi:hypothetical protein